MGPRHAGVSSTSRARDGVGQDHPLHVNFMPTIVDWYCMHGSVYQADENA